MPTKGRMMKDFKEKIISTLNSNGFPNKRVSLPVEKMYEAADNRGLNFNKVLESLRDEEGIDSDIQVEKVVFSKKEEQSQNPSREDMMKQAQDMMAGMSPEQLKQIQETFANMSPQEKEELMKKGRDLGLI